MDTQHTPGPWTATHRDGDRLSVVAADGTDVVWGCGCCGSPALWGNADADAALIAKAPDLYALALRIARLNRDVGEIGPGMLASLVDEGRRITNPT